jgi:hypothetical protein
MVRWRRRASSARYGVGATALTLRRLELAGLYAACFPCARAISNITWASGAMVFFIPWRVVAEESGAAQFFGSFLDRDGQGRGSYMSASAPIATAIHQNVIRR